MPQPDTALASYIADNYGVCLAKPCLCLRSGWRGRECLHWVPVTGHAYDLLRAALAGIGGVGR